MSTDLQKNCNELYDLFEEIKRDVRKKNEHIYDRWKAGGFLVDDDIVSIYPNLTEVVLEIEGEVV